ncbi:MAG: RDD family protein [Aeromicrobium sp.]
MSFRIIDGDAPGFWQHRAARSLALGCAWIVITPALLAVSFGIYVLIASVDPDERHALNEISSGDRLVALAVIAGIAIPLLALTRKLILGKRRLVLFLRHFGFVGGVTAVSNAAGGGLGLGFGIRLVTLDDRSAPVSASDPNTLTVTNESELEAALTRVRRLSGRLRGPTRLYLDVADPIWKNVVLRLVAETDAVLIDVTVPSPNLLWEIETVGPMVRPRWILVGEREGVGRLAQIDSRGEPSPATQLADLLDGEEIVAYHVGQDVTPFQQALRARYQLVARAGFASRRAAPSTSGDPVRAPWPPPVIPYQFEGPPTSWWPGRSAGLPADGPGSLASPRARIWARGIDVGIVLAFMVLLTGLEAAVREVAGIAEPEASDWLRSAVGLSLLGFVVAYDPVSTHLIGATPGKRLLDLAVIATENRQPATVGRLALRSLIPLLLWMFIVPGMLDALAARHDPLRQTWHDRAARTFVVRAGCRPSRH